MKNKDAIIIGSGQAAKPLSQKLSKAGWQVLMIEKSERELGGTCLNFGCTPTKTLIASANRMHEIKTADKHGISASIDHIDFTKTQNRKSDIITDSKESLKKRIEDADNLELIYGEASFVKDKAVTIHKPNGDIEIYTAPHIFIDAGSRPRIPEIKDLDSIKWYDSAGILELTEIPEKLVVIGGGNIGMELGQMFSRFGSEVTIVERSTQILSKEDEDIAKAMQEILEKEGIRILLNSSVEKVEPINDEAKVIVDTGDSEIQLLCSHLLVATGRISNADQLNTNTAGIELDEKGYIKVNNKLETNVNGIYALGDINGGPKFTHIAYNDYVIVYENLIEKKDVSKEGRLVPYCVYTDPQLGRIGMSESQAKEKGLDFKVVKIPDSRITRGNETGKTQGPWKALVESKTGKILGASILSTEGGEIASVIQMAMEGGLTAKHLARAIFSHPSYSESINSLFMELED